MSESIWTVRNDNSYMTLTVFRKVTLQWAFKKKCWLIPTSKNQIIFPALWNEHQMVWLTEVLFYVCNHSEGWITSQFLCSACAFTCIFDAFWCSFYVFLYCVPPFFISIHDMYVPMRIVAPQMRSIQKKYSMFYFCWLHWCRHWAIEIDWKLCACVF